MNPHEWIAQETGQPDHIYSRGQSQRTNLLPAAGSVLDGILGFEFDLPTDACLVDRFGTRTDTSLQGLLAFDIIVPLRVGWIIATVVGNRSGINVVRWPDGHIGFVVQRHLIERTVPLRRKPRDDKDRGLKLKTFECMYRSRVLTCLDLVAHERDVEHGRARICSNLKRCIKYLWRSGWYLGAPTPACGS